MACLEALAEARRLDPGLGCSSRLGHASVNIEALRRARSRIAVAPFLSYSTSLRAIFRCDWQREWARPGISQNPRMPTRQAARLEAQIIEERTASAETSAFSCTPPPPT